MFTLFAERAEEVFHLQSPFQERAVLVCPRAFQIGELSNSCERTLRCGDDSLVLVKVEEYFYFIADVHLWGDVTAGKENLFTVVTLEIKAEVNALYNAEGVILSEGGHGATGAFGSDEASGAFGSDEASGADGSNEAFGSDEASEANGANEASGSDGADGSSGADESNGADEPDWANGSIWAVGASETIGSTGASWEERVDALGS